MKRFVNFFRHSKFSVRVAFAMFWHSLRLSVKKGDQLVPLYGIDLSHICQR